MKLVARRYLILVLFLLLLGCGKEESGSSGEVRRTDNTSFTLRGLDGRQYSFESVRGKVVLLDFWATWCLPCKKAIPELISVYNKYKDKEFMLWGIGFDRPASLKSFSKKYKIPYPILMGTREVQYEYRVRAIPTLILIDKSGAVATRFQGYGAGLRTQLEKEINKLLKE